MASEYYIRDVINRVPRGDCALSLPPVYTPVDGPKIGLCVESMRDHMTDEGWVLFHQLQNVGWRLAGGPYKNSVLDFPTVDCREILTHKPSTILLQDKAEWDTEDRNFRFRDPSARFDNVGALAEAPGFRMVVRKDAHQKVAYNKEFSDQIQTHGWVVYYSPAIVCHLAPYIRPQHVVRTYHSVEPNNIPKFARDREGVLFSGAMSTAYPLRQRMSTMRLPNTTRLQHPGYHRNGCCTPEFLRTMVKHKVVIATSSRYGYTLRKMVEATACGCTVLTDLPMDEVLPHIDENLVRVHPDWSEVRICNLLREMLATYDFDRQRHYAALAMAHYDWRVVGQRLSDDIEALRNTYGA
jgi:hypothetical protein